MTFRFPREGGRGDESRIRGSKEAVRSCRFRARLEGRIGKFPARHNFHLEAAQIRAKARLPQPFPRARSSCSYIRAREPARKRTTARSLADRRAPLPP